MNTHQPPTTTTSIEGMIEMNANTYSTRALVDHEARKAGFHLANVTTDSLVETYHTDRLTITVRFNRRGTVTSAERSEVGVSGVRHIGSRDMHKFMTVVSWFEGHISFEAAAHAHVEAKRAREAAVTNTIRPTSNTTAVVHIDDPANDTSESVAVDWTADKGWHVPQADSSYDLAPATDLAPAMVVNTTRGARSVWERLAREASLDTLERVNASAHWSVTDLGHQVVEEELDRRAVATWTERAATMSDDGLARLATAEHTWELVRTIVRREIDRRATRSDREHEDDRAYWSATGHGTLVDSMNALDRAMAPTHHYAHLVDSMNALDRAMAPIVRTGRDIHTARISPALAHQTIVSVTGGNAARWER